MWTVSPILQQLEHEIKVNGQTGEGDIYLRFFEGKGTECGLKQATHTQQEPGYRKYCTPALFAAKSMSLTADQLSAPLHSESWFTYTHYAPIAF